MAYKEEIIREIRIANQFHHLGHVINPELFFDRKEEMEGAYIACEQILNGGVGGILVIGGKGVGKTSFLDALQRKLVAKKISCSKITLTESMVDPERELTFIQLILTELLMAAKKAELLEDSLVGKVTSKLHGLKVEGQLEINLPGIDFIVNAVNANTKPFSSIALRDGLADYIELINKKGKKDTRKGAVLIFDEGTCLTLNKNLMQIFKSVFQNTPGIAVIIAGSNQLLDDVSNVFSPLPRGFLKIELGPYPDDNIAYDAIKKPIELSQRLILNKFNHTYKMEVIHDRFDRLAIMTTGRMPLEINLLCHFAFDIAAQNCKFYDKTIRLFLNFNKQLLDDAYKQLIGTKGYSDFLPNLDENETSFLKMLSKSTEKATVEEMSLMLKLDLCKGSLQNLSITDIKYIIEEQNENNTNTTKTVNSIKEKAMKNKIDILSSSIIGQMYDVEDQFVRSYFKYGWVDQYDDIELGIKPNFNGLRVFGDPIATIMHSIFFPRISEFTGKGNTQRAHTGRDDGRWMHTKKDYKLLIASYVRSANNSIGHYAINLENSYETKQLENDFKIILGSIATIKLLKNQTVSTVST